MSLPSLRTLSLAGPAFILCVALTLSPGPQYLLYCDHLPLPRQPLGPQDPQEGGNAGQKAEPVPVWSGEM